MTVQWDLRKVSMAWLESCGWVYVRHVTERWVEMELGNQN